MIEVPLSRALHGARLAALVAQIEDDEIERWSRARIAAAAIPPDVDLDDQADVIRALFAARFCCADFVDVLDDAIDLARERRAAL